MKLVEYIDTQSVFHKLDPRTKMIICGAIMVLSLVFSSPFFLFALFIAVVSLSFVAKIHRDFLSRTKMLASVVVMAFILWTLFYRWSLFAYYPKSEVLFKLGPITVDKLGLMYGISMPFRVLVLIGAPLLFFMTTTFNEVVLSLVKLGVPYKWAFGVGLSYRLIPSFAEEWEKTKEAQISRGLELDKGGLLKRTRNYVPIIMPIVFKSLDMADQLAISMDIKAFGVYDRRTYFRNLKLGKVDYTLIALFGILFAMSIWLRLNGMGVIT